MSGSFDEFCSEAAADGDAIVQAARYLVGATTDYITAAEMRVTIERVVGNKGEVQAAIDELAASSQALEIASRSFLTWMWDEPGGVEQVRAAIVAAKEKLPVIETAILAMVAMYGMYLYTTKGRKRHLVRTTLPDGKTKEVEIEYYPTALSSLVDLFKIGALPTKFPKSQEDADVE